MNQPDWSRAPEGAEKYNITNEMFYRGDRPNLEVYLFGGWTSSELMPSNDLFVDRHVVRPHWNGTGLPPVGTVCECSWDSGSGTYEKAKVVAHDDDRAVFKWLTGSRPGTYQAADACGLHGGRVPQFRPIRTHEQIAADERESAIDYMVNRFAGLSRAHAVLMHEAGYRKQST